MVATTKIPTYISQHHPGCRADDDEYEEVTVLTFEDLEADRGEGAAGEASGSESFYYEEVTVADDETFATRPGAGTAEDPLLDDDRQGGNVPPPTRSPAPDRHESIGDNDEFSRMDESVVFRRAMQGRDARGRFLPTATAAATPTQLGRMASTSSSVAFSYANVGRKYDFVQILDDDDDDDFHVDCGRPQGWNEWQTLASQTLFVEDDESEDDEEEEAPPVAPSPDAATTVKVEAAAAVVRDIYWEPPITSVGWRWCGFGGGAAEKAAASPTRREHRRYFGLVLFLRGRHCKGRQAREDEPPPFLRF